MLDKNLNKNELLGIGNILFAVIWLFLMYQMVFNYVPAQTDILGENRISPIIFNLVAGVYAILAVANLFVGVNLFRNNKSESLHKKGMILFIVSIIGFFVWPVISTFLIVLPIYNLTESL